MILGKKILTNNLLAHWRLDDGAANLDSSGLERNIDDFSGGSIDGVSASTREARDFNGTSHYMQGNHSGLLSALNGRNNFTVSFWCRPDVMGASHAALSIRRDDDFNNGLFAVYPLETGSILSVYWDGLSIGFAGSGIAVGKWSHITVVSRTATDKSIYVGTTDRTSGLLSAPFTQNKTLDAALTHVTIGAWTGADAEEFDGSIDNIKIWDRDLTADEVNANWQMDTDHKWSPSLLALAMWLDPSDTDNVTTSGGKFVQLTDKSGNSNHATSSFTDDPSTGRTINGLDAMDFDGVDDSLEFPNIDMYTKAAFAVVEHDDAALGQIFSNDAVNPIPASVNVQLRLQENHTLLYAAENTAYDNTSLSTGSIGLSTPAVIGYILDTTLKYSVNGIFEDTGTAKIAGDTDFNQIGNRHTNLNVLNGAIGEIVVTSAIPSTDERQKLEGYLAWKWGLESELPVGHPYEFGAP